MVAPQILLVIVVDLLEHSRWKKPEDCSDHFHSDYYQDLQV